MKKLIVAVIFLSNEVFSENGCQAVKYSCDESTKSISVNCTNLNDNRTDVEKGRIVTSNGLIENNDRILSVADLHRQCTIKNTIYTITVTPEPGNYNIQGRCGAWLSATVSISTDGNELIKDFLGGSCDAWQNGHMEEAKNRLKFNVDTDN